MSDQNEVAVSDARIRQLPSTVMDTHYLRDLHPDIETRPKQDAADAALRCLEFARIVDTYAARGIRVHMIDLAKNDLHNIVDPAKSWTFNFPASVNVVPVYFTGPRPIQFSNFEA